MHTTTPRRRATGRTWIGLSLLLIPALLVSMDLSVLFVAAPAIARDLDPSATQWLWMMDVYGFVLAGLLVTMGSLGDRLGRRRLLLGGALAFGAASVLLAVAPTAELFLAGRALLGVGAATLAPSTLSLIRAMFTDPVQRRTAVGFWTVAFTGGAVIGPIIGGALLEFFAWGAVFLINLPFMALLLLAAPFLLPESRNPAGAAFDLFGAATSLTAVLGLVYAAKRFVEYGADGTAALALVVGLVLLAAFVVRQRRAEHPLIDISLFTRPAFTASVAGNTVVAFAVAGLGLLAFTFLQVVHGLSPLVAALYALPTILGTVLGAALASSLADRIRPARLMGLGLLAGAAGFGLVGAGADSGILPFLAGYTVVTLGVGVVATLANTLVLATAPPERAGAAAGVSETSTELGAALGIATLGTIAASLYRSGVERGLPEAGGAALETVAGAAATAAHLPEPQARDLLDTAFAAYTSGIATAALTGAAVLTAVAVLVLVALRRLPAGTEAPGTRSLGTERPRA
ncbi:MFS transporter [Nocardiopsis terrae]|uniref:DHA2 family multidrug resistance protein-like MFS transporter n=1 Tax=Nocardiopsis terrae TaxID=372655 RepID=A0ABR9HBR3_9ACTN|nr:MFS transporter [Nocardiopsis terrae]MBE1456471.1 DHA2 family multidrug resistance protein-like MFS transporter [Nocardiopsis terrae]GHC76690.1 MFS transporter [Nocardiopsis terrae]